MSNALSSRELAAGVQRRRPWTHGILVIAAALGIVLLVAALATLATTLVAAYREHQAFLWLSRTPAEVVTGQVRPIVPLAAGPAATGTGSDYRPDILVRYALEGQELEAWLDPFPDLPAAEYWEASERLRAFDPGDQVTLCYDPDDPSLLRLEPRDRSWRSAVLGGLSSLAIAMPGLGLVLAAWLLRKRRPPR